MMRVATLVLTSSVCSMLTACGTSVAVDDFPIDICGASITAVEVTPPVDGIELRGETGVIAQSGELCATAADRAACSTATSATAIRVADGFVVPRSPGEEPDHEVLVATRGSDVIVVNDVASLLTFVGAIDTAPKARLFAVLAGYRPACRLRGAGANAYEAYAEVAGSCGVRYALKVSIASDGTVRELTRDVAEGSAGQEGCR